MDVLLAVDGSKYGRWATEWITRLALTTPIRLRALHVVDVRSFQAPLAPHPVPVWNEMFIQSEVRRREKQGKTVARDTKALLSSLGLKAKVLLARGLVAPTILKHAGKRNMLIVLGSRGLSALDRFMLGSISSKVIHHAPCSVLVVKQPPRLIRRILLATDGSRSSEKAVQFLRRNMMPLKTHPNRTSRAVEVSVMHVMPFLRYPELKKAGKTLVQHTAERLAAVGFRTEEIPKLGHPAEEIIKYVERGNVDLVVMGARGLGAVARFFLGSVSTNLVQHSPCSVLVVR